MYIFIHSTSQFERQKNRRTGENLFSSFVVDLNKSFWAIDETKYFKNRSLYTTKHDTHIPIHNILKKKKEINECFCTDDWFLSVDSYSLAVTLFVPFFRSLSLPLPLISSRFQYENIFYLSLVFLFCSLLNSLSFTND